MNSLGTSVERPKRVIGFCPMAFDFLQFSDNFTNGILSRGQDKRIALNYVGSGVTHTYCNFGMFLK